jgi:alcohol dehydrogenase (cytochrome c)
MYTVQNPDDVVALDAATGRVFWTYSYPVSPDARPCCGRLSRGVAILGETLYIGTIDAHVLALDAKTGKAIWDMEVGKAASGYAITHAPQIVKDKVIVGMAGGEYGIQGYILALDAKTGKEVWRFYTIPGPGEPGHESWAGDSWKTGGASVWVTGSYDPDTNLLGHRQSRSRLEWRQARRRQPVQRFGGRAGRRHRQAQVVLPVFAAR